MEQTVNGTFFFDPEDTIYTDHFPQNPVVPGSLIVYAFMTAGSQPGDAQGRCMVENFRFRQFIAPGEYAYLIRIQNGDALERRMTCELFYKEKAVVTGILRYET